MIGKIADRLKRSAQRAFIPRHVKRLHAFLDAKQGVLGGIGPLDFEAVLRAYAASRRSLFFVQIGANNGSSNDPMSKCIRAMRLKGIVVEPQAAVFSQLSESYADQPQLILERAAIAAADGKAKLYKVSADFWRKHKFPDGVQTQISSLNRSQIKLCVELFGDSKLAKMENEYLETEDVPALTLSSLIAKHNVDKIELLQIDAEGFDYEILKMIDWAIIKPSIIQYETVNLPVEDRIKSWNLLRDQGYHLYASDMYNTIALSGPTNQL